MAKRKKLNKNTNKRNRTKSFPRGRDIYSRVNSVDAHNTSDVLQNPDPVMLQLNSTQVNYREILWDPHLTAVIASRKAITLSKEWYIEKNDAPARVVKNVEKAFEMFDVHRSTEEILDARLFGMQPMEPVWSRPKDFEGESKIFPVEFVGRPAWWFQYDKENHLRFRTVSNSWPGEEIKPYTLINPRNNPKYDNPYGEALLSKVYWSVNFKKAGFKFWIEYTEKYGSPFAVGIAPMGASDNQSDEFLERLKEMTKGSSVVIPKGSEIEFHPNGTKANADVFKSLVDFANSEISKAILSQTLTTEASNKGTQALGTVHNDVRLQIGEADEILCEECFGLLIRWFVDLNFGPNVVAPLFKYEHEEDIHTDLSVRDKNLKEQGVNFTKKYYMDRYNLSEDELDVSDPEEKQTDPDKKVDPNSPEFKEAVKSKFADQRAIDTFIASLTDEELQKEAEFVEPIIKMITKATSFDEANEGLLQLFSKVRPELLEKKLGRAMFNSENLGRGGED